MLHELRARDYSPNTAEKVPHFVDKHQMCPQTEPGHDKILRPPSEQIFDPCNGLEDILEVDLFGERLGSNIDTHIINATIVFSRYLFANTIRRPDTASRVKVIQTISTQYAYKPRQILTYDSSAFTSKLLTQLIETTGIKIAPH